MCENVGNKGCVLANHGLDATVCFAIRFKVLIWRMRDLECYFSITTELKHNLYQDVDSQCICIYIIHIYKLLKVYLTNLEYDAPLQSRLQLYSTTDVRISHIIAFITPHSGYLRTVPNGSEVPIFSRTISNYFRTICFLCPAYHRTVPNGSEVAYVIWAPLLGWDKFRLDWFKQSYFSILLKTVFIPSRACNITHVMCTLSKVLLFYWVIKIKLCQENRSIE